MQVAFPFIPYVPYEITMAIMRDQYLLYTELCNISTLCFIFNYMIFPIMFFLNMPMVGLKALTCIRVISGHPLGYCFH